MSSDAPTTAEAVQVDAAHTPANASLATRFEILKTGEIYEQEDGAGEYHFTHLVFVYRDGDNLYHATSPARLTASPQRIMELATSRTLIPPGAYRPRFDPATLTRAPDPLPRDDTYVKRPNLTHYGRFHTGAMPDTYIADGLLAEAHVCELLLRHPHPNIATYLGCRTLPEEPDHVIDGLCFPQYTTTLKKAVNPGHFNKRRLAEMRQGLGLGEFGRMLDGIESAVRHLHALGLVHNDVNPANIMRNGDAGWVLIDFGSCRRVGELRGPGTYEWYDEAVTESVATNDLDALCEIRTWLDGGRPESFQFAE